MNPQELITNLNWRYAVKKFDANKKIPEDIWDTLEQALVLTPSSYGLQPWRFIVITDQELREKLLPVSWGQKQVVDASHFVVFALRKTMTEAEVDRNIALITKVRGTPPEKLGFYRNMMVGDLVKGPRSGTIKEWAARQIYIALGNFMTCAAVLGVDACPIEGFQPDQYDKILDLESSPYASVVCCAAGYRSHDDAYAKVAKVRFDLKDVIERR